MSQVGTHEVVGRKRSIVWLYWAVITVLLVVGGVSHPLSLLLAVGTGFYTRYLYRGGSFVFWIW